MASSPSASRPGGPPVARIFGRVRVALLLALLALMALCGIVSWTTRGVMAHFSFLTRQGGASGRGAPQTLVNLQPWQTAQALAPLAVTAEEKEFAQEAERLADHEVDQAFAGALRLATLDAQHRNLTGEALVLSKKIAQLEQLKQQDQATVQRLTAQAAAAAAPHGNNAQPAPTSNDLEVAKAQLGLDTDELADAQRDLDRSSGDNSARIQDELAAHEESMRKYDSEAQNGGQVAVLSVGQNHTLARRIAAWFSQRERAGLINQALQQAQDDVTSLTAVHNALEAKANTGGTAGAADEASHIADLKSLSIERQVLSIDDDRIQTEQQLAAVYGKWSGQLALQHRIVLHLILNSLIGILFILCGALLCDALIDRLMSHPALERRQMRTLRSILKLSTQIVGVLLILLVIFGPPQQTPTILGLATAALTIALQDYIIAFLGWFVLMGKNGIHVGDWVEINSVGGEVIEIGLMSTSLLETGGMAGPGHPTGRRISFMNSFAIRGQYFNFSTAGQWMWDEIQVSAPASADINATIEQIHKAVAEETEENSRIAEQQWKRITHDDGLGRFSAAPVVNLRPTAAGIDLQIRYVTAASQRFDFRNRLYKKVFELLHAPASAVAMHAPDNLAKENPAANENSI
jgi:small-conductance mechanosensitive channel